MTDSLGIVIPAYRPNPELLAGYVGALDAELDPHTIRIELDSPAAPVREAVAHQPVTVNAVEGRRGKGAAITAGFEALGTDILAFADADGSTPAPEVERIVETVAEDGADLAVGSRRHPDATVTSSQSLLRESLGDGFAWLARQVLDVRLYDYQCGAKAMTTGGWAQIRRELTEPGFAWDIELVAVAAAVDLRVQEVPVEWHDHPGSTVPPFRTALRLARGLVRTRQKANRLDPGPFTRTLDRLVETPTRLIDGNAPPGNNE